MKVLAANKKLLLAKSGIKSMVLASNNFLLLAKTFFGQNTEGPPFYIKY
jgi:hypothetical protein